MNLKKISFIRQVVYLWRNLQDRHSYFKGSNNAFIRKGAIKVNSRIQVIGNRNRIILERGCVLKNSLIRVHGDDNEIILRNDSFVSGAELWVENNGCILDLGYKTFVGHHSHLACTEDGSRLIIGGDGMISSNVQIRTGDSHSILDLEGKRINNAASVAIGYHVWIGEGAKVLKGVSIADNSVVSSGAIVTKSFEKSGIVLAGVPAQVVKEQIIWDSKRI